MGLFDKKFCSICGDKIGLLGNRKLEDGNCCKNCAGKLSPWFSERRHSTVEDIKAQLAYREENKAQVAAFHTTRTLGNATKILLDEDAKKFMVTSARDLAAANPDVLNYSDVTGCKLDIDETRNEEKRKDNEGKEVSYIPPRYTYEYDFDVIINVNNPYFDEIKFRLNSRTIESQMVIGGGAPNMNMNVEYQECLKMGEEIRETLLQVRQDVRDSAAPKTAKTCPGCGASTVGDANGRCEYCGTALTP